MIGLIAIITFGLYLVNKKIKTEKSLFVLLLILSSVMLVCLISARISHIYHAIEEGKTVDYYGEARSYSWVMLLPDSFCSFAALVIPFLIYFKRYKQSVFIEAIYSLAILGMLSNVFYPEYFNRMPWYEARAICALIYHIILGFIGVTLIVKGYIKPQLKHWYYTPIALAVILTFGLFELTCLDFAEAYNITHPLVNNLAISSWYFLCLGYILFDVAIRVVYYFVYKNKTVSN